MADIELNGMESLDFPVDPSTLPTTAELPLGDVILEIKSVKPGRTKENTTGEINDRTGQPKVGNKMTVAVQFSVDEPEEYRGIPHTKTFFIGSDEDPDAKNVGTWKRNATLLMAMFKAARVGGKTFTEYAAAAAGAKVGATVRVEKSKDPKYTDRNVPRAFWEVGSRRVSVVSPNADMDAVLPPNAHNGKEYSSND